MVTDVDVTMDPAVLALAEAMFEDEADEYMEWAGRGVAALTADGWMLAPTEPAPRGTLLAELDACKPLSNAAGPAQGGKTFSGWEVPHWLMLRVRSALRDSGPSDD